MSYVICLKRGLLEACAWFPSGLPHTPFPYPLYLFSIIILSYESDHILSPMSSCIYYSIPCGAMVKESTFQGRRNKQCRFDPWVGKIPGVGNGTYSSMPAWRIQWTEESGGLQPMGWQRVGRN